MSRLFTGAVMASFCFLGQAVAQDCCGTPAIVTLDQPIVSYPVDEFVAYEAYDWGNDVIVGQPVWSEPIVEGFVESVVWESPIVEDCCGCVCGTVSYLGAVAYGETYTESIAYDSVPVESAVYAASSEVWAAPVTESETVVSAKVVVEELQTPASSSDKPDLSKGPLATKETESVEPEASDETSDVTDENDVD